MDPERFEQVRQFFIKHQDKAWSFTDCFSFSVVQEWKMRQALAATSCAQVSDGVLKVVGRVCQVLSCSAYRRSPAKTRPVPSSAPAHWTGTPPPSSPPF